MPLTKDVGYNMHELKEANKNRKKKRSRKQMIAIALSGKSKK